MHKEVHVYLSIGSNLGNPQEKVLQALRYLHALPEVLHFRHSRLYISSPASDIPQGHYVNAVCTFMTRESPQLLFQKLEALEFALGKQPKAKNAPRLIDIDLLFYGEETSDDPTLLLPHPRWRERLFVLIPLSELTETIYVNAQTLSIQHLIQEFINREDDFVFPLYIEDES